MRARASGAEPGRAGAARAARAARVGGGGAAAHRGGGGRADGEAAGALRLRPARAGAGLPRRERRARALGARRRACRRPGRRSATRRSAGGSPRTCRRRCSRARSCPRVRRDASGAGLVDNPVGGKRGPGVGLALCSGALMSPCSGRAYGCVGLPWARHGLAPTGAGWRVGGGWGRACAGTVVGAWAGGVPGPVPAQPAHCDRLRGPPVPSSGKSDRDDMMHLVYDS